MKQYLALTIGLHLICLIAYAQHGTDDKVERGTASYYGAKFHGKLMANGEKFDQFKLTAAHNKLPLGTWVKVSNLRNKKSVIVQITDRMHPKNKRLIDVSREAARQLGFVKKGLTKVKVEVVDEPDVEVVRIKN
ncbi:MAG: septal ring lytic transglycosylase RlpA family protein [Agriterribacter sp.]